MLPTWDGIMEFVVKAAVDELRAILLDLSFDIDKTAWLLCIYPLGATSIDGGGSLPSNPLDA